MPFWLSVLRMASFDVYSDNNIVPMELCVFFLFGLQHILFCRILILLEIEDASKADKKYKKKTFSSLITEHAAIQHIAHIKLVSTTSLRQAFK